MPSVIFPTSLLHIAGKVFVRMAPPSAGLPVAFARRKRAVLSSAILSVLLAPAGIVANLSFDLMVRDAVLSVCVMAALCIAPFAGVAALRMAKQDLEGIRKGIIPLSLKKAAAWSKSMGIVGSIASTLFLLIFLFQASTFNSAAAARDSMVGDLNAIIVHANSYRVQSAERKRGSGAYGGYAILSTLGENTKATYTATIIHNDTLRLTAVWRGDSASTITVELGPDGRLVGNVRYAGAFKE